MMKITYPKWLSPLIILATMAVSCAPATEQGSKETSEESTTTPLKEVLEDDFRIGAALNYDQVYGREDKATRLVKKHFNTISPENMLKWGPVHPEPEVFNFEPADKYVAFGVENDMFIVGHTLVWHSQVPDWVFQDEQGNSITKEALLKRMQDHISTVAGRYKGKIGGWDVVNEALEDDGSLRQTKWLEIIGEEFLQKAFEYARETDPEAELYYNDYSLWKPAKREGAVRLVRKLQEKGIKVDGIGMQGHYGIDYPTLDDIEASIEAFADLGVKVMITELDIDVLPNPSKRQGADIAMRFDPQEGYNPYANGLPDSVEQKLNQRYADIFNLFHKHRDKISRVTFWGVADQHSWLNDWPMEGRRSYPLVFDRNYQPKPAFKAIVEAVEN